MKFSMVLLAAVMTVSVIFSSVFGAFVSVLIAASFLVVFIIRSLIKRKIDSTVLVLALGYIAAAISYTVFTGSITHPLSDYNGRYITMTGTVMSNPEESRTSDSIRYVVRINTMELNGNSSKVQDTVLLSTKERFSCGDTIAFSGITEAFPVRMNENGFDTALYYKSQNIYSRIYSEDAKCTGNTFILSPSFISQKFYGMIDGIIYKYLSGDNAAVVSAVLTGNTHHFSAEFNRVLTRTAFKRLLHPAYLHIWIIITLIELVCGFINRKYRDILTVILIGIYSVLSCSNIGFTRCLVMIALTVLCRRRSGDTHYPDILAEILIVITLTMPTIIFNVKFVLSSAAGLLIWAFAPYIRKRLLFIPTSLRHMTAVIIVCALFLTPVSSVFFTGICIYSFLAPFIMMPVILMMLIIAPFVFLLLSIFGTAPIIGSYFMLLIWIVTGLPYFINSLPFSNIIMGTPSPSEFLLSISIIFMIYYYFRKRQQYFKLSVTAACGLFISVIISSLLHIGTTDFIFVNVGQGDGSVIHTAYGATVIIDGGGGNGLSEYDPGEYLFVPYLEAKGYYNIDAAFVSHFHQDHVQGVIDAINELHVKNVFCMPPDEADSEGMEWYNELSAAAAAHGTEIRQITVNTRISFDRGPDFDVYVPDKKLIDDGDSNDTSLLIKAHYGNTDVLYTGDMTTDAENEFIKYNTDVDADVLKVAHHGASTSTSPEWYDAVSPDFAVISCGENNRYGHPTKQTLKTLKSVRILRTDKDGDIKITADRNKIRRVSILK